MVKNNLNLHENLKGKTAIITGANSGIGFQAAKVLAQKNVKVIFACRNEFWGKYAVNKVKLDTGNTDLYYEYIDLVRLIKSVIFFRFFLLLIIVYLLSELGILNLKYFFISAAFASFIVSLDIIYQYIFGVNIIGLISYGHHNSGFFGDELIAGGFIQNFSFFSIFFATFVLEKKKILDSC